MAQVLLICAVVSACFFQPTLQHASKDAPNSDNASLENSIQKGSAKSRTLCDYQTRIIAYKDLIESRCLLEFLKTGEPLLGQNSPPTPSRNLSHFFRSNPLSKQQMWTIGGPRISEFCRGFATYLIQEMKHNDQFGTNDISEEELNVDKKIVKRSTKHFFVGKVRGQTQSQYLNYGNSKDPGKAEAESTYDGSKAAVSGSSGMGQAQSQSNPFGCEECYGEGTGSYDHNAQIRHPSPSGPGVPDEVDILPHTRPPLRPGSHQLPVGPDSGVPGGPGYSEQQPGYPGGKLPSYPGQQIPELPGQTGPSYPGQQIHGRPGDIRPSYPGPDGRFSERQPSYPGQQISGRPGEVLPSYPGQQIPGHPTGPPSTYPGQQISGRPGEGPSYPNHQLPGYPGPGYIDRIQPSYPRQQPSYPGGSGQIQPSYPGQQLPGYPSQQVPTYPGQQIPGHPGQQVPVYPSPGFPGQQVPTYPPQQIPGHLNQPSYPGQSIPGYPGTLPYPPPGHLNYPDGQPPKYVEHPGGPIYSLQPGQKSPGELSGSHSGKFNGQLSGDYGANVGHRGKFSGVFSGEYEGYQNGKVQSGGITEPGTSQNYYVLPGPGQGTISGQPGYVTGASGGGQPGYIGEQPGYVTGSGPGAAVTGGGQYNIGPGRIDGQPGYIPGSVGQPGYGARPGSGAQPGYVTGQPNYVIGPGGGSGQPGYVTGPQGAGQPGYVAPPGSGSGQPGYITNGGQPGYIPGVGGGQPGYITGPGGAGQPGYVAGPAVGGQPGYFTSPGTGGGPGYVTGPGANAGQPGYITGPGAGGGPGYATGPGGSGGQPGYVTGPGANGAQNGYVTGPGAGGGPGYAIGPGGNGGQPGYGTGPGAGGGPGYVTGPGSGQPGYAGGGGGYGTGPGGVGQPGYGSGAGGTGQVGQIIAQGGQTGYYDQYGNFIATGGGQVDDSDSQVQTSVQQTNNETQASAAAQGKHGGGTAQSQVQGTYTGSGSFSASAGSDDGKRGALTQVAGGKEGAQSSAQGRGGLGQSQAQVQLSSDTGDTVSSAQTGGWNHGSQTQVQASGKGGMADAQANGPGSTSSQAQIGFTPQDEHDVNDQTSPYRGGGQASAQSGTLSGQAQSQIQGKFLYGIKYTGAAQAGSGSARTVENARNQSRPSGLSGSFPTFKPLTFSPGTSGRSSQSQQAAVPQPLTLGSPQRPKPTTSTSGKPLPVSEAGFDESVAPENFKPANMQSAEMEAIKGQDFEMAAKPSQLQDPVVAKPLKSTHMVQMSQHQLPESHSQAKKTIQGGMGQIPNNSEEATTQRVAGPETNDDYDDDEYDDEYDGDFTTSKPATKTIIAQTGKNQKQHIVLDPLEELDATVQQSYGDLPPGTVLQPGQRISGFQIPQGFRGRVKSIAGGQRTYATGRNSQAQTVTLTPGSGRIVYKRPLYGVSSNTQMLNGHYGYGSGYTYHPVQYQVKSGKSYPNFVSVSRSETGSKNLYTGKKSPSVYYTQSSSCGVFTNTCVFNGSGKVCFPKPKTNPDGSLMGC